MKDDQFCNDKYSQLVAVVGLKSHGILIWLSGCIKDVLNISACAQEHKNACL